jgi:hypothetical protein
VKIYDLVGRCDENSGRDGAGYFVVVMNLKKKDIRQVFFVELKKIIATY